MQRPLVGEYMSSVFEPNSVVQGAFDFFADNNDFLIGKPLDIGRLFYKKLHDLYHNDEEVLDFDVVWDHKRRILTGMVEAKDRTVQYTLRESDASARRERHALVDSAIKFIQEKLCNCQ